MPGEARREGLEYSFVDLMTSLVVIFVLLLVVFLKDTLDRRNRIVASQVETKDDRAAVVAKLREAFGQQGIAVSEDSQDPLSLLIVVPESLLHFEINRAEVPIAGEQFLANFGPTLTQVLCRDFAAKIDSLVVEGHTDSTGTEIRNIPLSAERATAVVLALRQNLLKEGFGDYEVCFLKLASASGRGPRELIRTETGEEDRGRSRRVLFRIRVKSTEQRSLRRAIAADAVHIQ